MQTFFIFNNDILDTEASLNKFRKELNNYVSSQVVKEQLILDALLGIFKQFKNSIIENKCLVNMVIEKLPKVPNSNIPMLREQIKTYVKNHPKFVEIKGKEGGIQYRK
jgi:hypothetical protein